MKALRVHGMEVKYLHRYVGWNARLDALHAAMLRVKLPHLDAWTAGRQAAAARYDALLDEHGLGRWLARPARLPQRRHVFNQYVVRVAGGQRDALVRHLQAERIGCEVYYPIPLHLQECLAFLGHKEGDFPVSEAASHEVLALPMFPEITAEQQRRVVQGLAAFLSRQQRRAA
jgi:dTDP-4-amino-4,6-dideoxygalactose transaminase